MSLSAKSWKQLSVNIIIMLSVSTVMMGCASSTGPSQMKALVQISCPELTPLTSNTFGATTMKLQQVAAQYYKCKVAAETAVKEK